MSGDYNLSVVGLRNLISIVRRNYSQDLVYRNLLKSIILQPHYAKDSFSFIIDSDPDQLRSSYSIDREDFLNDLFACFKYLEIDVYKIPYWKERVDSLSDVESLDEVLVGRCFRDYSRYVIDAADLNEGYNWEPFFKKAWEHAPSSNWIPRSMNRIVGNYASSNTQSFKQFVDDAVFFTAGKKPNYSYRALFYRHYAKEGLLDSKTARKIRSDASEEASVAGLKALIESDNYDDKTELLLKFSDSKHTDVLMQLAKELPIYLLTSIMGTDDYWVKRTIEGRLMQQEEE
tara:strand:+ start:13870 stop:14733 length:864 start_codon:yes stop_codon:yes gene_type:complete